LSAVSAKRTERTGERERTLTSILFTFQETYEEKFPKMAKMTKMPLKVQKF
jgi:hypothetical protein